MLLQGIEASFGEAGVAEGASARGKMGDTGKLNKVHGPEIPGFLNLQPMR
jgi:hypothetical protein